MILSQMQLINLKEVDPCCHEKVLRRFLKIVDEHATIKNVEIFKRDYIRHNSTEIPFSIERINNILGLSCNSEELRLSY